MLDITEATRQAASLRQQGRWRAAIAAYQGIARAHPSNPFAFHNLAAILGDFGFAADAERATLQAQRLGLDAPETWLVRARAVQQLGRFEEAERLLQEVLRRRPLYLDALRDLSQLRWMSTASVQEAVAPVDAALARAPGEPALQLLKARTLTEVGEAKAALRLLREAAAAHPREATVLLALAQAALMAGTPSESLRMAQQAMALAPTESATRIAYVDALLVLGELDKAEQAVLEFQSHFPHDQHALARLATVWRLQGDARYHSLYDFDALVSVEQLDTPPGWPDLVAFVSELATALHQEHRYRTHPFEQSIRNGSQVDNILQLPHRTTQALARAIDGPIRRHLQRLGQGPDPVRACNQGHYATQGGWSIRMQAGGRHVNHVHPEGWISTACYVETPDALAVGEGVLKLGEPGLPLDPLPPPERLVEPQLGRIVLFPSYMWHGTTPFAAGGARMSVAFDLVPAPDEPAA